MVVAGNSGLAGGEATSRGVEKRSIALAAPNVTGPARPELKEALDWIRRAAENGYADAQFELGRAFAEGQGLPQNFTEAARWYRRAAEQGHTAAQTGLAGLLESGHGAPSNPAEAIEWYRRAAEHGHGEAQYRLGLLHAKGGTGEPEFAEAAAWYRRAAEQNHARAQLGLGSLCFLGLGVAQDYLAAHMWLNMAAAKLPPGQDLDRALALRDRVAKMLTPAHLVEAQSMARAWQGKRRVSASRGIDPVLLAGLAEDESPGE